MSHKILKHRSNRMFTDVENHSKKNDITCSHVVVVFTRELCMCMQNSLLNYQQKMFIENRKYDI